MSNTTSLVLAAVLIAICVFTTPASAQEFSTSWSGVAFETPIEFSAPAKLGLNAVSLTAPPAGADGEDLMEITLVTVPADMAASMENDTALILGILKGTFLATSKPGTKIISRNFLGQKVEGEGLSTTIPKAGELAYYLVPLGEGAMILIALRWDEASTSEDVAAVLDMIAETLREIPAED
jgi:hypothetical protein